MKNTININDLFDQHYYLSHNRDVAEAAERQANTAPSEDDKPFTPLDHFLQFGQFENRDPSLLFSQDYYLKQNPDVAQSGTNALQHFIEHGAEEGRNPSYLFDKDYYLASNPDVANAQADAFLHFIEHGEQEGRSPTYLFDKSYYLAHNQDVAASGINPVEHFITYGLTEGRVSTALFDQSYYLAHNQDVAAAGINPFQHYLEYGQYENRVASTSFNSTTYLQANPDVATAIQNGTLSSAIEHYILFGKTEGRQLSLPATPPPPQNNTGNNDDNDNGNGGNNGNENEGTTNAPVNSITGEHVTDSDIPLTLHGLSVTDSDSATLTITFTTTHGTISINEGVEGGVDSDHITNNDSTTVTFDGTIAAINATLAAVDGISFTANDGFSGPASITMTSSDGSKQDSDVINITVNATHSGTVLALTADADNLAATDDMPVTFSTSQSDFDESDTLAGGTDTDILLFTDSAEITASSLNNKTAIDMIRLSSNSNSIEISNDFVSSSDNDRVEIDNRNFTITSLNTSDLAQEGVIISGTGLVTLADAVDNFITIHDDVNGSIQDGDGNDTIIGGSGDDKISLRGGDNSILGGDGDDTITGSMDNFFAFNTIDGGDGTDTLAFTDSTDIDFNIHTDVANIEILRLSDDDNSIIITDDFVQSTVAKTVQIDNGNFAITSLDTSDLFEDSKVVVNGSGTVTLADNGGNIVHIGNDNNGSVIGAAGNDTIIGGSGDDTITGGEGQDSLTGGDGADMFVFHSIFDSSSDIPDIITDFDSNDDVIQLTDLGFEGISAEEPSVDMLEFSNDGENTIITDAAGNFMLILVGVHTDLSEDNIMV